MTGADSQYTLARIAYSQATTGATARLDEKISDRNCFHKVQPMRQAERLLRNYRLIETDRTLPQFSMGQVDQQIFELGEQIIQTKRNRRAYLEAQRKEARAEEHRHRLVAGGCC